MPANPFRSACLVAGCPNPPHTRGKCQAHARQADELRGLNSDRVHATLYASAAWRQTRAGFLSLHPWCECESCEASGRYHKATVVHHVRPHGGDVRAFFDPSNLRAYAKPCHSALHAAAGSGGMASKSSGSRSVRIPRGRAVRAASGFAKGAQG
jgi:5-methylcytosine-specific restriction protein A